MRGFRRGIYAGNVDFYVGHVENWIAEQTNLRSSAPVSASTTTTTTPVQPFLSYAILDMPSAHLRIPHVTPLLRNNGVLVIFVPSITQIGDCVNIIRRQRLPFMMDRVVELGSGISSGRLWDVRFAEKKSRADPSSWSSGQIGGGSDSSNSLPEEASSVEDVSGNEDSSTQGESDAESQSPSSVGASASDHYNNVQKDDASVLVCRPKVGIRIVGGGFVGLWRRVEDTS